MTDARHWDTMGHMSEMTDSSIAIPMLTLGWRMQMALRQSEHSVQAMADNLGVTRQTVGRWINDRGAPPKKAYVTQWAWLTRVPVDWLERGVWEPVGPDGGPVTTSEYENQLVLFTGLACPTRELSSHSEAWQVPAARVQPLGAPKLGLAGTRVNEQQEVWLRSVPLLEPSVAEVITSEKVPA